MIVQIGPVNTPHFVVTHVSHAHTSVELATMYGNEQSARPESGTNMVWIAASIADCTKWLPMADAYHAITNVEPCIQQNTAVCKALIERERRLLYGRKHDLILKLITTIKRFHHFKRCFITGIQ